MASLYPEISAGGFSRIDGSVAFFSRVNALLAEDMDVLEFGAGRGVAVFNDPVPYRQALMTIRGKVKRLIGVDIDPAILNNPFLDEAYVVPRDSALPINDEAIDLIVSDWTFEHVQDPVFVARELTRVLKPGGWLCARTPNRWGYVGLGANLVPNKWHASVVSRLQPDSYREASDVFPTVYKMNTVRAVRRLFPDCLFENYTYTISPEPTYFGTSVAMWRAVGFLSQLTPSALWPHLLVFLRKREQK
jgi:SAM-dependent methyltransferase